jgi:hypothetical protein
LRRIWLLSRQGGVLPQRASSTAPDSDTNRCFQAIVVSPPWCAARSWALGRVHSVGGGPLQRGVRHCHNHT